MENVIGKIKQERQLMQKPVENEGSGRFFPQPWARRLGLARWKMATIERNGLHVTVRRDVRHGASLHLSVQARRGWVWSRVIIKGMKAPVLGGLSHNDADRFIKLLEQEKPLPRLFSN
jgi:hypothetical protein